MPHHPVDSTQSSQSSQSPPPRSTPPESRRTPLQRVLRGLFGMLTVLLVGAGTLAVYAHFRSSTPLPAATTGEPDPAVSAAQLRSFQAAQLHFPGRRWQPAEPADLGWDAGALERAHDYARSLDTSSLMVLHRGVPVAVWGDVDRRESSQSMRKALLGSLIGRLVAAGQLDLDASLLELGIDDEPPLTASERQATVRHLLLSRSGIYRSALYETGGWKRAKPERGSASPGEEWYYNNWGFNALATIYEQRAGEPLHEAFAAQIAGPLEMQDYRARDVVYLTRDHTTERLMGNRSDHPAYVFMISARDLARFGLLYLAGGRWNDAQIVPEQWVHESTFGGALPTGWGDTSWGYLWWVDAPSEALPYPSYSATGGRGHSVTVVPALELVIVHRIPDGGTGLLAQMFRRFVWHPEVDYQQRQRLLELLLAAYPSELRPSSVAAPASELTEPAAPDAPERPDSGASGTPPASSPPGA